jgi:tetratricopeptide (TPR) repeat protein
MSQVRPAGAADGARGEFGFLTASRGVWYTGSPQSNISSRYYLRGNTGISRGEPLMQSSDHTVYQSAVSQDRIKERPATNHSTAQSDLCESASATPGWWARNRWFLLVVGLVFIAFPGLRWMFFPPASPPVNPIVRATELLNRSLQYAQSHQFTECVNAAREATRLNPKSAEAFNNLGFCLAGLQLWEEAIRQTTEAIRLDPSLQLARNNLSWMLQEQARLGGK